MTFLVAQCTEQTSMKVLIQSTFFQRRRNCFKWIKMEKEILCTKRAVWITVCCSIQHVFVSISCIKGEMVMKRWIFFNEIWNRLIKFICDQFAQILIYRTRDLRFFIWNLDQYYLLGIWVDWVMSYKVVTND